MRLSREMAPWRNEQPQEGLDDYWITMPHGGTSTFFGAKIIENGETRTEEETPHDLLDEACVELHRAGKGEPVFPLPVLQRPLRLVALAARRSTRTARGGLRGGGDEELPRRSDSSLGYNNKEYFGQITAKRRYAAELSSVDDGVGPCLKN